MVEASETAAVPRNGHTVAAETAETISPTGLTQTCGTPWRSVLLHGKNTKLEEEAWGKKKEEKQKVMKIKENLSKSRKPVLSARGSGITRREAAPQPPSIARRWAGRVLGRCARRATLLPGEEARIESVLFSARGSVVAGRALGLWKQGLLAKMHCEGVVTGCWVLPVGLLLHHCILAV